MKKILVLLIIVFVPMLTACQMPPPTNVPFDLLVFEIESNPDLIGSYTLPRVNQGEKWLEWGEWTPAQALIGREVVCLDRKSVV